ncbi:MAG: hypothetical protein HQ515_10200 [Phycisphaeraceae bacterium]|nr:hypothetical protein [Phycisphaeraceae bacterium]
MNKTQWDCVPENRKIGTINCPLWMIENNIVPVPRAKDVIAGRQSWGDDDEKDAIGMCDVGDRNGWH